MSKGHIEELRKKVNKAVSKYNELYEDDESMANDILDYAEVVMRYQKYLIVALQNELRTYENTIVKIDEKEWNKIFQKPTDKAIENAKKLMDVFNKIKQD